VRSSGRSEVSFKVDTRAFQREIDAYVKHLEKKSLPYFLRYITQYLMETVIPLTPVLTGKAQKGWHPALSGSKSGSSSASALGSYTERLSGSVQHIVVVNKVDYIMGLEYGRSTKAPGGMLRIAIARTTQKLRSGELSRKFEV
jgi:hypothetical protein